MLEKRICSNGLVTYISPLMRDIGVPHAFSTRIGGISPKPFDSLNLGNPNGCEIQDLRPRIRENYALLMRASGCERGKHNWLHQVHGGRVVRIAKGDDHDNDTKGDALISDDPSRVLSVRVADCVPVLLAAKDGSTVAAVHAGWRGVIAGVVTQAVRSMLADGTPADGVVAAIGPSISFEAFEVGGEVLEEFGRVFGETAPTAREANGKGRVDLRECLRRQLIATGLPDQQIDTTDRCTFRDREEFFSHRRDQGISGRMAAIIAPRVPRAAG